MIEESLYEQIRQVDKNGGLFLSLVSRPKSHKDYYVTGEADDILREVAIVHQGPLDTADDFTAETVRMYKNLFPGVQMIISTWEGEDKDCIGRLREEGCIVLENRPPEHSGILNLNYQTVSAMAGISKAKELGKKYVLKTRNDHRFYKSGIIEFMVELMERFPVIDAGYQRERIVLGGPVVGSMYMPFWLSDRYVFGTTEDMLRYWDYSMDETDLGREELIGLLKNGHFTIKDRIEKRLGAESNIVLDYLYRMEGSTPECTVENSWNMIKRQFITLSMDDLGVFWHKYNTRFNESERTGNYYTDDGPGLRKTYNWNLIQWMNLYCGRLHYLTEYEELTQNRYE